MRLIKFISLLILLFSIVEEKQSQCSNFNVNAGLFTDLVTETLYSEDFTGQNGKGARGTNPVDLVGCTWNIDVSNTSFSNVSDYFMVVNEELASVDLDGNCLPPPTCPGTAIWFSPIINIQDFIKTNYGKNVLISGHSNTTPSMVNKLIKQQKFSDMLDTDNKSLFVVRITDSNIIFEVRNVSIQN